MEPNQKVEDWATETPLAGFVGTGQYGVQRTVVNGEGLEQA